MQNREIKFRAYDIKRNEWIDIVLKNAANLFNDNWYSGFLDYLTQYTGIKDKNGKEIYEGDILNITNILAHMDKKMFVEWDKENCSFDLKLLNGRTPHIRYDLCIGNSEEFEITGNIFENPELLEDN